MNCESLRLSITDLARERELSSELNVEALTHVNECSRCARILSNERILSAGLAALAAQSARESARVSVENRLLQEFHPKKIRTVSAWVAAAAVAAVLLVMLALAVTRPQQSPVARVRQPSAAVPTVNTTAMVLASSRPSRINRVRRRARAKQPSAATSEFTTDFYPLPFAEPLASGDSKQVVRIRIPRSTLIAFGIPFNDSQSDDRLQADIVMGQDGIARAIRFIR